MKNYQVQGICEQEYSHHTILGSNLQGLRNRICQWCDTENLVLTPRTAEDEEQNGLDREQLTNVLQKKTAGKCKKFEATRCYNSLGIARR